MVGVVFEKGLEEAVMLHLESLCLLCFAGMVPVIGITGIFVARLGQRINPAACQATFYLCFLVVGLATMVSLSFGSSWLLVPGTTFSAMVVGATLDLGRDCWDSPV